MKNQALLILNFVFVQTDEGRSNTVEDTSCDEQLAKILQEEEEEERLF